MDSRYHIHRAPNALTLARHAPAHFDVAAEATLADAVDLLRLAHQVRQDVWRALRRLRGFSPTVEIRAEGDMLHIRAGGRAMAPFPPTAAPAIQAVLDCPNNRRRWLKHASRPC